MGLRSSWALSPPRVTRLSQSWSPKAERAPSTKHPPVKPEETRFSDGEEPDRTHWLLHFSLVGQPGRSATDRLPASKSSRREYSCTSTLIAQPPPSYVTPTPKTTLQVFLQHTFVRRTSLSHRSIPLSTLLPPFRRHTSTCETPNAQSIP